MNLKSVQVHVPGKLMLAGEYSILYSKTSLSTAIGSYMHIELSPDKLGCILIDSELWQKTLDLDELLASHADNPLVETLEWCRSHWGVTGIRIKIRSDFRIEDGFGSSSAIRLGVLTAVAKHSKQNFTEWELAQLAWRQQMQNQGFASGYDLVSQKLGGWILFNYNLDQWPNTPSCIDAQDPSPWLSVFVGGGGAPTLGLGAKMRAWLEGSKQRLEKLHQINEQLISAFKLCLTEQQPDLSDMLSCFKNWRTFMRNSPCYPKKLLSDMESITGIDSEWSLKTTGAGGEDALLVVGYKQDRICSFLEERGWHKLSSPLGARGLYFDD